MPAVVLALDVVVQSIAAVVAALGVTRTIFLSWKLIRMAKDRKR